MTIKIRADARERSIASIKRYFEEHLDQRVGDLKASMVLDFCLKEIGPVVYNQAILDAQSYLENSVAEIESTCYEPEFPFWREL
ncbi:DUF2164 domain-containing protein [Candidatus Bipolaricaulota bacterium]|nr:DUF2164 domain-containing protein [Candidatus Bipolaricaulota bacterium]